MTKIDYTKLRASPEREDFSGKYKNNGIISNYLVNNYFRAVQRLLSHTEQEVHFAHEIGAGEGLSTLRLKKMVKNLTASEFVDDLVKKARANNPDLKVFKESVYELTYNNSSCDLIFLLEVLEHLDYPEKALEEIRRVSNKYLILGVPREPLWRVLNFCRGKYLKDLGNTPGHLNHWSKQGLVKLVEQNFGQVISVQNPIPWTIVLAKKYG